MPPRRSAREVPTKPAEQQVNGAVDVTKKTTVAKTKGKNDAGRVPKGISNTDPVAASRKKPEPKTNGDTTAPVKGKSLTSKIHIPWLTL